MSESTLVWWSRGKDILTLGIIPLALWCVHQEIRVGKVELILERQAGIESDLRALQIEVAKTNHSLDPTVIKVEKLEERVLLLSDTIRRLEAR